jgi:hypothetical protein
MINAQEVLKTMCEKYQAAVSANDSVAYGRLFAVSMVATCGMSDKLSAAGNGQR